MSKITPCLWFNKQGEEAVNLYVSLVPDSKIVRIHRARADYPGGKEGDVLVIDFTLAGQSFMALNGGSDANHSNAVSFSIDCKDQAEVDRLWDALLADGGKEQACGWLNDRFGVPWQIVPEALPRLMNDPDPVKSKRVMEAMMNMVKIDVAGLEAAYEGRAAA